MTENAIHQNSKCFHGLWDDNSYTCDNQLRMGKCKAQGTAIIEFVETVDR